MWEIWDGDIYLGTVYDAGEADAYAEAGYMVYDISK